MEGRDEVNDEQSACFDQNLWTSLPEEPQPTTEDTTEVDVEAINDLRAEYFSAANAADVEALLAVWANDGVSMPPNQPAVTGKEAIRSLWQERFDQNTYDITFTSDESVVSGDWAFVRGITTGTLTPKAGGEPNETKVKSIALYQRQVDGSWKTARVIYSSDNPPAGQ